MLYVAITATIAILSALAFRRAPKTTLSLAMTSLALGVLAVLVAVLTGSLLLYYLGGVAEIFGLCMLIARAVFARPSRSA
jgi:hypothetical protein